MVEVIQFQYNSAWPIWAVLDSGVVIQCCQTEEEAQRIADELNSEVTI